MTTPLEKNQVYTVGIEGCTSEGQGVARVDGRAIFVREALPGEQCRIRILKVGKAAAYAKIEELIQASPYRQSADCLHFGKCGGCDFRHVDYEEELRLKRTRVNDAFRRIGGLELEVEEILGAADVEGYRAKAIFAVGEDRAGKPVTGFYRARSHEVISVERCLLQTEEANLAAAVLRRWMAEYHIPAYREESGKGLIRHLFVRSGMVCLVSAMRPPRLKELVALLRDALPELCSVILNHNDRQGNTVLAGSYETLWGKAAVDVTLGGLHFSLSPQSFFQVNPAQAERLYRKALDCAGLSGGEMVVDLYCGAGAIGLLSAARAREVIGVEIVPDAVRDAQKNAERNGVTNIRFLCADAAEAAAKFAREGIRPDVLFVDPPRKGLEESVVADVVRMQPERLVYVSCDPGTLARDLSRFAARGYAAVRATAVDMFPKTCHVETVCLLSKLNTKQHIEVELNMDELDLTSAESKATYEEIKEYVLEQYGLKVSHLYIAQIKKKYGIIERENYNKPKSEETRQPQCPANKEMAITEALKHFGMIRTEEV